MERVKIVSGSRVTSDMISQALQLDRISYDEVYFLDLNTCLGYYKKNSEIYIMALDERKGDVIGYINYSPVYKATFDKLVSGNMIDTGITEDDIRTYPRYAPLSSYYGYFSSIVVHPAHRQHLVATQMLEHWTKLIVQLARERRVFFRGIVADAVSDIGEHLLSQMGFSLVRASHHDSKIMLLEPFSDETPRTAFNSAILDVYRE